MSEIRKLTVITATTKPDWGTGGNHARALALCPSVQFHLAKGIECRCPAGGCASTQVCGVRYIEIGHNSLVSSASGQ